MPTQKNKKPSPKKSEKKVNEPPKYLPPQTFLEARMGIMWSELLGLKKVSVMDDFYELGGDKPSAAKIMSRLSNYLKVDIPLEFFFETPTIRDTAKKISNLLWGAELNVR